MTDDTLDPRHHAGDDGWNEDRIPLDPRRPVELFVANPNGEVTVRGADRDDALIRTRKRGRAASRRYDEARLVIEARDNRIEVRPEIPGGSSWDGVNVDINVNPFKRGRRFGLNLSSDDVRYDIEVELPRAAVEQRVQVQTASGDVAVADIAGAVELKTASGNAQLRQTRGDLSVQTASGDVRLEQAAGRLTLRTASGDAQIEQAALDALTARTASGDLNLDLALTGDGPYEANTVSGNVRLAVAPIGTGELDRGTTIVFSSVSGDARFDPAFRRGDRRTWHAGPAGSGPRIAVKTVSGDLNAHLGASLPPAATPRQTQTPEDAPPGIEPSLAPPPPLPPAPPLPPFVPDAAAGAAAHAGSEEDQPLAAADDAARLAVLEAVERGEIDVEEALQRLDGTPEGPSPLDAGS